MDPQSPPLQQSTRRSAQDRVEAQNAAACAPPSPRDSRFAGPSSSSDVKRSDAAYLARQLATSSSWSETFMPRSPETRTSNSVHSYPAERSEEQANMYPEDPPPAYSRAPEVHELPADSVRDSSHVGLASSTIPPAPATPIPTTPLTPTIPTADLPPVPHDVCLERQNAHQESEADAATPLLGNMITRSVQPICGWWERKRADKLRRRRTRRRKFFFLFFAIMLGVGLAFTLGFCARYQKDNTWFHHHPTPSATSIPTSRVYERHLAVGSISGNYKLYDRLDLSTTTGSINIEIDPQEGDLPAVLSLSSDIGSVTLRVSQEYLRRRNRAQRTFQTTISSFTGTVNAEILLGHGGAAFVDTTFGSQTLSVIGQGLGPLDQISNLTTLSRTGSQKIIVASLDHSSVHLAHLHAEHHVVGAGSMDISYPSTWQGEIHAIGAPIGSLVIEGDGLEYRKSSDVEIIARRRYTNVTTTVEIINEGTGSISFKC